MIVDLDTIVPDRLTCPDDRLKIEYVDTGATGLYLECRRSSPGQGTFWLRYKGANKRTSRIKIGRTSEMGVQEARRLVKLRRAELTLGKDPRAIEKEKAAIPTFGSFFYENYLPQAKVHNRRSGWQKKERMYELRLKKVFGDKRLNEIKRHDVSAFHMGCRNDGLSLATSDRYLALARNILSIATDHDLIAKNPCKGVKQFNPDNRVNHFLSDEEMKRLVTTLKTHKNRTVCLILLFALSTGMRIGEVLKVRRSDLDLERKLLQIPAHHAKGKRSRTVPLNQAALDAIAQADSQGKEYLWINKRTGKPFVSLRHAWQSIRKAAGLEKMRIHDLRHQFASHLMNQNVSPAIVQELMGHAQITTTISRYSHLSTERLSIESNRVADAINSAMEAESSA
jgi:integrase